ncbi:hypothetical protein FV219_22715 [Methylobacterium sp. WL122]|nr:hypothetical protein FV219_22715 [Methylobacterium sp. WL122]
MPPTRVLLALCLFALLAPSVRADPLRLVLGTATPGGGFPAYGAVFAAALHEVDPDLTIETQATGGSAENVGLLRAGAQQPCVV